MKELLALREKFDRKILFESFGAKILLECGSAELLEKALERANKALLGQIRIIDKSEESTIDYRIGLGTNEDGTWCFLQNEERTNYAGSEYVIFNSFDSFLRLRVAEYAEDWVFVHAGVVAWNSQAVIVPAPSHKGKTTLVAELIKNGAEYYSDEYALLDKSGLVHPFPRDLSIRGPENGGRGRLIPPELLGRVGRKPIRAGAILFTEYKKGAKWAPRELTIGQGIMETIPHSIPIHLDPKFSLEVLNNAYKGAIIAKSFRGDVRSASPKILGFLDKYLV